MSKNEIESVEVFAISCKKQLENAITNSDQTKYAGKKICIEEMSIAEIRTFWESSKSYITIYTNKLLDTINNYIHISESKESKKLSGYNHINQFNNKENKVSNLNTAINSDQNMILNQNQSGNPKLKLRSQNEDNNLQSYSK